MTVAQMVKFLRINLDIPDPEKLPEGTVIDPLLLQLTDEDLILYLDIALSQGEFANSETSVVPELTSVPNNLVYRLIIFAQKALYFSLATKSAPDVDLGADNNNYLKQDQRFQHYMKLIGALDNELARQDKAAGEEDGGGGTNGVVMTYDVTLTERFNTPYNYQKRPLPTVLVNIVNILTNSLEIAWTTSYISKFDSYKVWVSKNPTLDLFSRINERIRDNTQPVFITSDPHENTYRLENLEDTSENGYYIVVGATTKEGLTGYSQVVYFPPKRIISVEVVDGDDGYTPVTTPVIGQKLTANVTVYDGTGRKIIGSYPVNTDIKYMWFYQDSFNLLGTSPVYTVTSDNADKVIALTVSSSVYEGDSIWTAAGGVEP